MRIAIDISGAIGRPSGMRRYAEELLKGLSEIDRKNEYFIYAAFWKNFPEKARQFDMPRAPNFKLILKKLPQRLVLPLEARLHWRIQERLLGRYRLDLFHELTGILPRLKRLPAVVTLHHVGGQVDAGSAWKDFYFNELTGRSVLAADRIIAASECTKAEAVRLYGVAPEKIEVVWEGGASAAFQAAHDPGRLKTLKIARPYLLFVSAINLRKNLMRLVRAFAALRAKTLCAHSLVLVGPREASYAALKEETERLGLGERVRFLEKVGQEELNALYREADLFVYPSLLEGFGLPMLEAMTCGVPVLAARASCLPEIAGEAALYFNGTDEEDLARQMERALSDAALRQDLVRKGFERAKLFDWRETARKTLRVYETVVAGKRPPVSGQPNPI